MRLKHVLKDKIERHIIIKGYRLLSQKTAKVDRSKMLEPDLEVASNDMGSCSSAATMPCVPLSPKRAVLSILSLSSWNGYEADEMLESRNRFHMTR